MNFIPGTVSSADGRPVLRLAEGAELDLAGVGGDLSPTGAKVSLGIRPEQVRLLPGGSANAVAGGTVISEVYVGGTLVVHVALDRGPQLRARIPAGRDATTWRPGERVLLAWDPADARMFATEGADTSPHPSSPHHSSP